MGPPSWTPARALAEHGSISPPFPQGRRRAACCQPPTLPTCFKRGMCGSLTTASAHSRLPTPLCSAASRNVSYKAKSHLQMLMRPC